MQESFLPEIRGPIPRPGFLSMKSEQINIFKVQYLKFNTVKTNLSLKFLTSNLKS